MKNEWMPLENDQRYTRTGKFGIWLSRDENDELTGRASVVYATDGASASGDEDYPIDEAIALAEGLNNAENEVAE